MLVETDEGTRTIDGVAHADIPALVAQLVADGRQVFRVEPVGGSLEQAYLEVVGEDRG